MQILTYSVLTAALIGLSLPVMAEDAETPDATSSEAAIESATEESLIALDLLDTSSTLTDEELGSQRARENIRIDTITVIDQDQDGDVSDNVAVGNTNGDNLINGEAFSNSSGFLSTVQNTGNNVLIQNSTIINVSVETPGE